MTTQTATDELTAKAAAAWAMLTHPKNARKPVQWAVDRLREESGCEDVAAVKAALYGAGAGWLIRRNPDSQWPYRTRECCEAVRSAKWEVVEDRVAEMRHFYTEVKPDSRFKPRRLRWCDRADVALALCRLIEAA